MDDEELDELDDEAGEPDEPEAGSAEEQEWVRSVAALPCPACHAQQTKPIIWGMPTGEDYERYADVVVFGGCVVPQEPWPTAHCAACGHNFIPADH